MQKSFLHREKPPAVLLFSAETEKNAIETIRKAIDQGAEGFCISIKTKERLAAKNGKGMPFGVVVTLKEMNGVNRIDEFIKRCILRGWIVNEVDIVNRMDVYHSAEEEVKFD